MFFILKHVGTFDHANPVEVGVGFHGKVVNKTQAKKIFILEELVRIKGV
jgi:hypothetical protein